jgi:hypothetical protein
MKKRSAPAPWTIDLFAHFARLGATGGAVLLADGSAPNALCTAYGILLQAQRRHRIKQDDGSAVYGVGRTPSGGRSIRLERPPKGRAFRAVDRSPRRLGCLGHVAQVPAPSECEPHLPPDCEPIAFVSPGQTLYGKARLV